MPTALSTTKRKFNKLLDSISNASSSSLPLPSKHSSTADSRPQSSADQPSKRARTERPLSAHVPSMTQPPDPSSTVAYLKARERLARPRSLAGTSSTSTTGFSSQPAKTNTSTAGAVQVQTDKGPKQKPPPNFAPWDRAQFLARLKTFRHVDKWTSKPDQISEVEWARRGWSCTGRETVSCVGGCGKQVAIVLEGGIGSVSEGGKEGEDAGEPETNDAEEAQEVESQDDDDWRENAQKELVEKYAEMISTAHDESCLWRRRGCDDSIQRLPVVNYVTATQDLCDRYVSLSQMKSELPDAVSTPSDFDEAAILKQFPHLLQSHQKQAEAKVSENTQSKPILSPAVILALFGWQAEEGHVAGLATCNGCFRRLGLWLFKASGSSDETGETQLMNKLDVIAEHRDYCPWINSLSQNGSNRRSSLDGLAGWQTLLKTVTSRALTQASSEDESDGFQGGITAEESATKESTEEHQSSTSPADILRINPKNEEEEDRRREAKDKERWARLKRVSQIFRRQSVHSGGK